MPPSRPIASPPREDEDIEAALRAGDKRRALILMMDRYGDVVLRFAYSMSSQNRQSAEEVRQQVFVEAHRDMDRFAGRSSLLTWLIGIARHRCLDAAKARNRWNNRFKNELDDEPIADHDPGVELDKSRIASVLAGCLDKLAPAAREAVVLRYQQELSYEQAAAITREQAGTLQQRVARALPVLRKCVEARLGGAP
jgi:RNA polymerase sigma-70 factor (ECF subfamily)